MPLYELTDDQLSQVDSTTFVEQGIKERSDIQRLLKDKVDIISPHTLVIAEEFGEWEESRRRIDLLGLDKDANLVVIELKRTEDGGFMDLQALRYAAMVSTMTFSKAVDIYSRFLQANGKDEDPSAAILEFLEWDEVDEENFAQDVKIVLASAEFSKELTTTVMWLNNHDLDVTCIRLKPYSYKGSVLLDVEQIIPLPEAVDYQIKVRDKTQQERKARKDSRDLTRYDVVVDGVLYEYLPKRRTVLKLIKALCDKGVDPEEISRLTTWRRDTFRGLKGNLSGDEFFDNLNVQLKDEGKKTTATRYFCADDELIYVDGKTYALTKMWGKGTERLLEILSAEYPDMGVSYKVSE